MKNNENISLCGLCKGKCCKQIPGEWSVSDVLKRGKTVKRGLLNMIEKDLLQFDWWEGDVLPNGRLSSVYFPRPTVTTNDKIAYGSWGFDSCKLLTEKGCSLSWDDRPEGCKSLIPAKDGDEFDCNVPEGGYHKEVAALEWRPHQKIIRKILRDIDI